MISILLVVLTGLAVGWWSAQALVGWKSYAIAILVALVVVPAVGYFAADFDVMLLGGSVSERRGTAVGLALAVALIEVPLIVYRRKRRNA